MAHNTRAAGLYYTACCFLLYFVAAAVSFNGYYDKWHFNENGVAGEDHRFQFEMMVDGTAYRPFIYRQMLPSAQGELPTAHRAVPLTKFVFV